MTSDRCISVDRGVPQGAPESALVFVMVADEILGGLRPSWERRNFAWTCDAVSLSCLGCADDVLLFSGSKASLETMIEDCCTKFGEAGLEVGLDKTYWSSSIAMDGETLAVRGQSVEWERKLEFIGSVIEPGAHSGGAVRHRTQKAILSLLQVETSLVQSESVLERENESVWGEHSFECHVAEWLLDSVEATGTSVGILVCTSLEPDGGFQA